MTSLHPPTAAPAAAPAAASARRPARRLGDVLLAQGLLDQAQLDDALEQHRRVGEPLGQVLLARGVVTRRQLYVALAQVWGTDMSFVDPVEVDTDLALLFPAARLAREVWLPLRTERDPDGALTVVVATAGRPSEAIAEEVTRRTGVARVRQVVTTDWDVRRAIRTVWRDELAHEALISGTQRRPVDSASRVLTWAQLGGGLALLLAVVVGAVAAPAATLGVVLVALGLTVAVPAVTAALRGPSALLYGPVHRVAPEALAALDDADLPRYTVLVPVRGDADVVEPLLRDLGALHYPHEKLEVLLLVEEDDADTLSAALSAAPPELVRFVVVPRSLPATRGRTLDVGLTFASGEHVVVYDAGDSPDPDQLRRAVLAFRSGGSDLVALQARRRPGDGRGGLVGRLWSLDGDPLRGTSAHLRTAALRSLGGWDAFNLAEDADVVLRARARGLRVARLDSTTVVGPAATARDWLRERSRVIVGSLQTALVHSRTPLRLLRRGGRGPLLVLAGTPVAALALPWLDAAAVAVALRPSLVPAALPTWSGTALVGTAAGVAGLAVVRSAVTALRSGRPPLVLLAPLAPLWALAQSVATVRAVVRLLRRPFTWEHTRRARCTPRAVRDLRSGRHAAPEDPTAVVMPQEPTGVGVLGRHAAPEPA